MSARARGGDRSSPRSTRASRFQEELVGSGPPTDSDAWRKVHRITPILQTWQVFAVFVGVVAFNSVEYLRNIREILGSIGEYLWLVPVVLLGSVVLVLGIAFLYSHLAWKRIRYAVDSQAVYYHQGIFFKAQRTARLSRIQAVDVIQPFLGRLFGLARVDIETAGGGDSKVQVAYLSLENAEDLRAEILARAAGVDLVEQDEAPASGELRPGAVDRDVYGTGASGAAGPGGADLRPADDGYGMVPGAAGRVGEADVGDAGEGGAPAAGPTAGPAAARRRLIAPVAPERKLFTVPPGRLIGSLFLDMSVLVTLLAGVVAVAAFIIAEFGPGALAGAIPALVGAATYFWGRFAGEFGHEAAVSPDGIRMRRGLLEKRSQTLPPGRVQAVRLRQPMLWRLKGWWRVQVNVAGYGGGEEGESAVSAQTVLLPVGPREDALTALWLVLKDVGTDDPFATIDAALEGHGEASGFLTSPRRVRVLDPLSWRHNGLLVTRTALIVRQGRFSRTVLVVPHERTQSLGMAQGPLERRLKVASMISHSVSGPAGNPTAHHLDEIVVRTVLEHQAERARTARAQERPEEWQRRVGVPGSPDSDAQSGPLPNEPIPTADEVDQDVPQGDSATGASDTTDAGPEPDRWSVPTAGARDPEAAPHEGGR